MRQSGTGSAILSAECGMVRGLCEAGKPRSCNMRSRQQGATFLGMVVIVAIVGFGLYAGVRLTPLYLEYLAVVRAMEQTAKEHNEVTTPNELRIYMDRRWVIEDIKSIQPAQIDIKKAA